MYSLSYLITTPPTATALAEASNLRSALGISTADVGALQEITLAIDAATGAIQQYCNRVFARRSLAARYRANGRVLVLDQVPVIGSLLVEDTAGDRLDVDLEFGQNVVRQDGELFEGIINIHYEGGYEVPGQPATPSTLPSDVELACQDLAKWFYLRRARDPQVETEALSGLSAAGYAVPMGMPEDVAALIEPYRLSRI